jgi:hypothetical protein
MIRWPVAGEHILTHSLTGQRLTEASRVSAKGYLRDAGKTEDEGDEEKY